MGVISPIGEGISNFWEAVLSGKSGIREVQAFDTARFRTHNGAEVINFDVKNYLNCPSVEKMGRASQFAIAATKSAIEDANIDPEMIRKSNIGVSLGTTMGEIQEEEKVSKIWVESGVDKVPANHFLQYPCGNIPRNVAAVFGLHGPNLMVPTACASGNYAIGYAFDMLKEGKADFMIAGGVDPFSRVAFTGFNRLLSVAPETCQPFDGERKGMIVGEGAGILVMETLESAKKRGASIYAEVLGYGLGCDAHHMTTPHPEGYGGARAIKAALDCAGVTIEDIDYISAHGTGTKENDRIETKIIKKVFKERAKEVPMSSIKSMIGHTMGAASAIEAVLCALVVKNNKIPPTINFKIPDPECDLDYVPNVYRECKVDVALSNAYAFGGNDAALLIGKYQE